MTGERSLTGHLMCRKLAGKRSWYQVAASRHYTLRAHVALSLCPRDSRNASSEPGDLRLSTGHIGKLWATEVVLEDGGWRMTGSAVKGFSTNGMAASTHGRRLAASRRSFFLRFFLSWLIRPDRWLADDGKRSEVLQRERRGSCIAGRRLSSF